MPASDPPPIRLSFTQGVSYFQALQRRMAEQRRAASGNRPWQFLALWLLLVAGFVGLAQSGWFGARHLLVLLVVLGIVCILASVQAARQRAYWTPCERGGWLGRHDIVMSEEGICITRTNSEAILRWPGVLRMEETPTHLFLMTDRVSAIVLPKQALTEVGLERVKAYVTERVARG